MNNRSEITSIAEFDSVVVDLNNSLNRLKNLFGEETKSLKMFLTNDSSWNGKAKSKANEKYEEISNMYPSITQSLDNFISFLVNTSEKYKQFEQSLNTDVETNKEDLDVNS